MQVQEIMTSDPACCKPDDNIKTIAQQMIQNDCGEIPVSNGGGQVIGVVTDRDICCRAVAQGMDPETTTAQDVMTQPVFTVKPTDDIDAACQMMEQHMIRRVPVVDDEGCCCGIVSLADIAEKTKGEAAHEVLKEVSNPTPYAHA